MQLCQYVISDIACPGRTYDTAAKGKEKIDTKKRKRLEAVGWRTGNATDFLELEDAEAALVEMKLALSDLVRLVRAKSHLTQGRLAQLLKSSQSRVAKLEAGDPSVSFDMLVRAALAAGASRAQVAKVLVRKRRLAAAG